MDNDDLNSDMSDSSDNQESPDGVDNYLDKDDLLQRPSLKDWRPSVMDPFPTFRCTQIMRNGERCPREGITGMLPENSKCHDHGGSMPSVKEKARARIEAARMRILDDAPAAAEVLASLTLEGTADNIRLKASTEILDRAGIRGGVEIDVSGDVQINSAQEVRNRLAKLVVQPEEDEDIHDAEVVDESGEEK